jgi:uncharacterized lipoprotein
MTTMRHAMRGLASTAAAVSVALLLTGITAAQEERGRVFRAPPDRVWAVTTSVLQSLGWRVDNEDRAVGWIVTKSRGIDHDDYGVYAKGIKHRLRVVIKGEGSDRTAVTVERRVWKEERILWIDKEEEIQTTDRKVEQQVLEEIARSL